MLRPALTRRSFIAGALAAGVAACSPGREPTSAPTTAPTAPSTTTSLPATSLPEDPFTLGVASGDPLPGSVVLWTRLVPDPASAGGGMPPDLEAVPVRWQVALDPEVREVVAEGTASAEARWAHSVHVDVTGLDPSTTYWYRFTAGGWASPIGRTRTLPPPGSSPEAVRLAVASCQAYQTGYFTAYRHMAAEELDAVLFLGDYIYELESSVEVRPHGMAPPVTVDEYRRFYALYKTDEDLQAAHAALPWIVTWDDHEVEDNYADGHPGALGAEAATRIEGGFAAKRAAAYQAWWEHMPLRTGAPRDGELEIYRSFQIGDLVTMAVLDTRQYRTPQPTGEGGGDLPRAFGGGPQLEGAFDPDAQMLGAEQERWLADLLGASGSRWNVIAQQSIMAEVNRAPDRPEGAYSMDSWDGYVVPRQRLLERLADLQGSGVVSVGGDLHTSVVADLHLDPKDPGSPLVGTELIGPSVSALELLQPEYVEGALSNPHIHLYDIERRGYLVVTFERERAEASFRYVETTAEPGGDVSTGSRWEIERSQPGATRLG